MNACVLLEKLIDIERSIGVETETSLHRKVIEAQEYLLEMQREMAEGMQHKEAEYAPSCRQVSSRSA